MHSAGDVSVEGTHTTSATERAATGPRLALSHHPRGGPAACHAGQGQRVLMIWGNVLLKVPAFYVQSQLAELQGDARDIGKEFVQFLRVFDQFLSQIHRSVS